MGAVGAVDPVARAKHRHRADRARFLPDAHMSGPMDEPEAMQFQEFLLETADEQELLIEPHEQRRVLDFPIFLVDFEAVPRNLGGDRLDRWHIRRFPPWRYSQYKERSTAVIRRAHGPTEPPRLRRRPGAPG